jgi:hypothetical protein
MYVDHDGGIRTRSRDRDDEEQWAMLQLGLIDVIRMEREREIEDAIRLRRLLKPQDEGEAPAMPGRVDPRILTVRVRPTEG